MRTHTKIQTQTHTNTHVRTQLLQAYKTTSPPHRSLLTLKAQPQAHSAWSVAALSTLAAVAPNLEQLKIDLALAGGGA